LLRRIFELAGICPLGKDDAGWVKRSRLYEVDEVRGRGNHGMTDNMKYERV